LVILFWQSQSHGASIFTHLARADKRAEVARFSFAKGGSRQFKSTAAETIVLSYVHLRQAILKGYWNQRCR
jgi:hypothetical protein